MQELYNLLKTLGMPITYHHFKEPPSPPYIVYLFSYSNNFGADDKVYDKSNNYQVELYSTKKDLESEKLIEDLFNDNNIFFEKTETYLDTEGLYEVLYEI